MKQNHQQTLKSLYLQGFRQKTFIMSHRGVAFVCTLAVPKELLAHNAAILWPLRQNSLRFISLRERSAVLLREPIVRISMLFFSAPLFLLANVFEELYFLFVCQVFNYFQHFRSLLIVHIFHFISQHLWIMLQCFLFVVQLWKLNICGC